jgi:hypothetical protein
MFLSNHTYFIDSIPFDVWIDIIMRLASQCAIAATNALRLINDHCPLVLAFRGIAECFGGWDRACSGCHCNPNGR